VRFARRAFALRDGRAVVAVARIKIAPWLRRMIADDDVRLADAVELKLTEAARMTRLQAEVFELSMGLREDAVCGFRADVLGD
jgi:hypothetical protein